MTKISSKPKNAHKTKRKFSSFQRSKIAILNFQKTKEKIVKVETWRFDNERCQKKCFLSALNHPTNSSIKRDVEIVKKTSFEK